MVFICFENESSSSDSSSTSTEIGGSRFPKSERRDNHHKSKREYEKNHESEHYTSKASKDEKQLSFESAPHAATYDKNSIFKNHLKFDENYVDDELIIEERVSFTPFVM